MSVSHCSPEFPVSDVAQTQAYYRDTLGFSISWIWDDSYGAVSRGDVTLFFCQNEAYDFDPRFSDSKFGFCLNTFLLGFLHKAC